MTRAVVVGLLVKSARWPLPALVVGRAPRRLCSFSRLGRLSGAGPRSFRRFADTCDQDKRRTLAFPIVLWPGVPPEASEICQCPPLGGAWRPHLSPKRQYLARSDIQRRNVFCLLLQILTSSSAKKQRVLNGRQGVIIIGVAIVIIIVIIIIHIHIRIPSS